MFEKLYYVETSNASEIAEKQFKNLTQKPKTKVQNTKNQ